MKKTLIAISLVALMAACCPSKEEHLTTLSALHTEVYASLQSNKPDTARIELLTSEYAEFIKNFPEDSIVDSVAYRAACLQSDIRKPVKALELFNNLLIAHPDGAYAPKALFRIADINDNQLKDTVKAKEYYNKFLAKYPKNELASSAEFALQNMGKSAGQILQELSHKTDTVVTGVAGK